MPQLLYFYRKSGSHRFSEVTESAYLVFSERESACFECFFDILDFLAGFAFLVSAIRSGNCILFFVTGLFSAFAYAYSADRGTYFSILLFAVLILISLGIGVLFGFIVGMISTVIPAMAAKILMAVVTSIINGYLGIVMMAAFMVYYLGLAANTEKRAV